MEFVLAALLGLNVQVPPLVQLHAMEPKLSNIPLLIQLSVSLALQVILVLHCLQLLLFVQTDIMLYSEVKVAPNVQQEAIVKALLLYLLLVVELELNNIPRLDQLNVINAQLVILAHLFLQLQWLVQAAILQ